MNHGTTRQAAWPVAHATDCPKARRSRKRETIQTEATKHADALTRRVVDSSVEAVLVVGTSTGTHKIGGRAAVSRAGKFSEHVHGSRRHGSYGNLKRRGAGRLIDREVVRACVGADWNKLRVTSTECFPV